MVFNRTFCNALFKTSRNTQIKNKVIYSTIRNKSKVASTVDAKEVDYSTNLREIWWQTFGPVKALHSLNFLRVPFIRDGLVQVSHDQVSTAPLMGKKILDIGCGGGILSMPLAKLGADVTGVDASEDLIKMAQDYSITNPPLPGQPPNYICASIEEYAKNYANFFDGIAASEIIEHIDNDQKELFLKSCIHALKPGGKIFFTAPTRTRVSQLMNIWIAEYVLSAIPKGTHHYDKFITPNKLTILLERNNCKVELVTGMMYNYLKNEWRWSDSTAFFYALQAIKLY